MNHDVLLDMLDELRRTRPPVYLADEWRSWIRSVGQTIAAYPTEERRMACAVLVANDLVLSIPGLSLQVSYGVIAEAVERAQAMEGQP